jgi:glycine/D-amino acid oxidase-like deaminating enzyme
VKSRYPHLDTDGVTGGVWLPKDGQGDPANIALALAKGARQRGAPDRRRRGGHGHVDRRGDASPASTGRPRTAAPAISPAT